MDHVERDSWWRRNWQWVVACSGIVVIGAMLAGVVLVFLHVVFASSVPYTKGLATARANASVVAALGDPVKPGLFPAGTINTTGASGHADLAIPLSGPKGRGTLFVTADETAGRWTIEVLEVEVRGRKDRIDLLKTPPTKAP